MPLAEGTAAGSCLSLPPGFLFSFRLSLATDVSHWVSRVTAPSHAHGLPTILPPLTTERKALGETGRRWSSVQGTGEGGCVWGGHTTLDSEIMKNGSFRSAVNSREVRLSLNPWLPFLGTRFLALLNEIADREGLSKAKGVNASCFH